MSAAPEARLVCPVCKQAVASTDYEGHLRLAHQLTAYRGAYRLLAELLDAVRADLPGPHADEAWQALLRLSRDRAEPDRFLAEQLSLSLQGLLAAHQPEAITHLAALLPADRAALLAALSDRPDTEARRLALALAARAPLPLAGPVMAGLRRLILDRRLPEATALDAVAALLRRGGDDAQAAELLDLLTDGLGTAQSVARLRLVERRGASHPALTARFQALEDRARMSCPRCGVQLRRAEMEAHLWAEHRLVLENLRVRDPWAVVEDWLAEGHLDRCRAAAANIDPIEGPARLQKLLHARGVNDTETRRHQLTRARHLQATCCPWCFALQPAPRPGATPGLAQRGAQLLLGGYRLAIDETGLRPWLHAETPEGVIYRGAEPGQTFTLAGTRLLFAGSMVAGAFACAWLWPAWAGKPIVPVVVLLFLAAVISVVVRAIWRARPGPRERLFEHAWRVVAPRLHQGGFVPGDATFLAALARLASRGGRTDLDPEPLGRFVKLTEQALERGQAVAGHLAELARLQIEIEAHDGDDPVPRVVRWVARCFEGKLPIRFAQQLLEDWGAAWWGPLEQARLRVLLCDRAFEAGFEVQTLLDVGTNAPALGTALGTEAPRSLAALRLVWSLRATRPWDRLGEVRSAFEVAARRDGAGPLREQQALLLYQESDEAHVALDGSDEPPAAARLALTLAGVWVQGALYSVPPRVFEVRGERGGFSLVLGNKLFRSRDDLEPLARLVEKWFRYAFHELLPQVDRALKWESPHRAALLRAWGAVKCGECGGYLMPRAGQEGVAVEAGR